MLKNIASIEQREAANGFVSNEHGVVICGSCLADSYFTAVLYKPREAGAIAQDFERFDPSDGDDWCSRCDKDITPRQEVTR